MQLFSPAIKALIESGKAEAFFFMKILYGNGTLYRASTTHHTSFTMGGVNYISDDYIVSVDPPRTSTTVDREQYKVTLADPYFTTAISAETGLIGRKMEARIGFLSATTNLPLTDPADSIVVYKGRIDGLAATISAAEVGEASFVMSFASPMVSLDMRKGLYFSRDTMRSRNPADSSADMIYTGSGSLIMKWGKL